MIGRSNTLQKISAAAKQAAAPAEYGLGGPRSSRSGILETVATQPSARAVTAPSLGASPIATVNLDGPTFAVIDIFGLILLARSVSRGGPSIASCGYSRLNSETSISQI